MLLFKRGSVDVSLSLGDMRVACEISVTTSREQELKNVEKCLAAGYDHVLVVTEEAPHANKLRAFVLSSISPPDAERLCVLSSGEVFSFLDTLVARMTPTEENGTGVPGTHY